MLALLVVLPALADVAIPPPKDQIFTSHYLRVDDREAHPDFVLLAYDSGETLSTHRAWPADREAEQLLARGGRDRGGQLGHPGLHLLPKAAYEAWATATSAEIARQEEACADRGEGCAHISRFAPSYPPPEGATSCGHAIELQRSAPEGSADKRVDVVKIVEASASSCKVEASGTDGAGGDAPSPTSAPSSGCATVTSAASLLTGLALLLGLGRRRPD
jgi:hypothetical protein